MNKIEMNTITAVLDGLKIKEQCNEFTIDDKGLVILKGKSYRQQEVEILRTYRFEGDSDPSDEAIIYLIQAIDGTIGYSLDAYGVYTNHANDGYAEAIHKMMYHKQEI
jgi:hypothetical protein